MKIRVLKNVFQLIALYSIAITANAGSSATAITTITANIVPTASFSVTEPILFSQQLANSLPISTTGHRENTPNSAFANSVILRTTNTGTTAKFSVKSSQNLAYDVSMPTRVSVSDSKSNITANISHTPDAHEELNINEEYEFKIGGAIKDTGAYHGLIDITINYN